MRFRKLQVLEAKSLQGETLESLDRFGAKLHFGIEDPQRDLSSTVGISRNHGFVYPRAPSTFVSKVGLGWV